MTERSASRSFDPSGKPNRQRTPFTPIRVVVLLLIVLAGYWANRGRDQRVEPPGAVPAENQPAELAPAERLPPSPAVEDESQSHPNGEATAQSSVGKAPPVVKKPLAPTTDVKPPRSQIPNVTIRDLDGRVIFRGTVDVQTTLDRIAAGRKLDHRNDGSTFQNRERRLPRQSADYYKEYVHPTPGQSGPGPQRIVVGAGGETYYTPDHYRTFERLR